MIGGQRSQRACGDDRQGKEQGRESIVHVFLHLRPRVIVTTITMAEQRNSIVTDKQAISTSAQLCRLTWIDAFALHDALSLPGNLRVSLDMRVLRPSGNSHAGKDLQRPEHRTADCEKMG